MDSRQNFFVLGVSIRWQSWLEVSHIDKHPISPGVQYRNAHAQNLLQMVDILWVLMRISSLDVIYLLFLLRESLDDHRHPILKPPKAPVAKSSTLEIKLTNREVAIHLLGLHFCTGSPRAASIVGIFVDYYIRT